ncbi:hypothetical protein [Streptomyces sp. NPDC051014]|uniref:hypothetical protein n=1 Tax=Streptomyces sp. NPDC051014 TaxID=3155751 RepID=UPI0033F264D2
MIKVFLIVAVLVVFVLFVAAGVIEARGERRPPARIVQPPRPQAAPPVTRWEPEWLLMRARRVRSMRGRARWFLDNPTDRAAQFAERDRRTTH